MKKYDPVLCMMVEDNSVKTNDAAFQKGKKYWSDRFHRYVYFVEIDGSGRYIFEDIAGAKLAFGANEVNGIKVRDGKPYVKYVDLKSDNGKEIKKEFNTTEEAKRFIEKNDEKTIIVKASGNFDSSSVRDASHGHEIIVRTENYLRSIGKNNGTGKYDRVVRGVKSLLEQGFLEGPELERAIKQEADRLLKKYNPNDSLDRAVTDSESLSSKNVNQLREIAVSLGADRNKLYGTSKQALIIIINKLKNKDALDRAIKNCDDMYMLLQSGKAIKAFQSVGAPLNEAKKYIKEKGLKGVFVLRNNKTNGSFTINANDFLDKEIRSCDTGESVTYKGYIIVNQGSYWFIKGINNVKFPSDKEAIEWLKENK